MSPREPGGDLHSELPDDVAPLARRLRSERPQPSAALHARVQGSLLTGPDRQPDPDRVKLMIAAFGAAGALLLALGALVTFL